MKEKELRTHATCNLCGNKVMATGLPLFWTLTIERWGIDANAMRRAAGLEMMIGNVAIAKIMGPDEDMAKPMMEPVKVTVCEDCCTGKMTSVAMMAECGKEQEGTPA